MSYNTTTYSTNGSGLEPTSLAGQNQLNPAYSGCGYDCGFGCEAPYESAPYGAEINREDENDVGSQTSTTSTTLVASASEGASTAEYQRRDDDDQTYEENEILSLEGSRSLDMEPRATADPSTAPSSRGSMGTLSPMSASDVLPDQTIFPRRYLFHKSPLPLNPQCRGHPIDMLYLDLGDWRS